MKKKNSDFVLPRQNRRERIAQHVYNSGPWSEEERLFLLKGLRRHGIGRWKEIGTLVTTRDATQIKSYAQKLVQKMRLGVNIFAELEDAEKRGTDPPTPPNAPYRLRNGTPATFSQQDDFATTNTTQIDDADDTISAATALCHFKLTTR